MRKANYKLGWIAEPKLAGLTHFHSEILPEDIAGVFRDAEALIQSAKEEFHIIIDNRKVPMESLYSLKDLQESSPFLQNELLGYVVIVKPDCCEIPEERKAIEEVKGVFLMYVDSIGEAVDFLQRNVEGMRKAQVDRAFFPGWESS